MPSGEVGGIALADVGCFAVQGKDLGRKRPASFRRAGSEDCFDGIFTVGSGVQRTRRQNFTVYMLSKHGEQINRKIGLVNRKFSGYNLDFWCVL